MNAKLASLSVRAIVGAGLAGVVADLADVRSLLVTVLVLAFIAVAPAAAIAGLLRGFDLFARLVLAVVTAIIVVTLIAMIMLAIGGWSPKAALVVIALGSGACALAQHAGLIRSRLAERAEPLRQAMIDYCVAVGGEQTAKWAAERAEAKLDRVGDAAPELDQDDGTLIDTDQDDGTLIDTGQVIGHMDGQGTMPAGHGTGAANGSTAATDGPAEGATAEPQVMPAESVADEPPRFRDTA